MGMRGDVNEMMKLIQLTFRKSEASIKSLSEVSGVPYASCYGVVKEGRDPALSTAAKLCKVLGLQLVSVERKA